MEKFYQNSLIYVFLSFVFLQCNSSEKGNEKGFIEKNESLLIEKVIDSLNTNYKYVPKTLNDSLELWKKSKIQYHFIDGYFWDGKIDRIFTMNKPRNKVLFTLLSKSIIANNKMDGIKYIRGYLIKNKWYFINGPYMALSKSDTSVVTSWETLHQYAMKNIFINYLKKNKKTGKYEINDHFFDDMDHRKWGFFDKDGKLFNNISQEKADSFLIQNEVLEKWKHIDTTDYAKMAKNKLKH